MFHNDPKYTKLEHGVKLAPIYMSYHSIYDDVDTVVSWMHQVRSFARIYVVKLVQI